MRSTGPDLDKMTHRQLWEAAVDHCWQDQWDDDLSSAHLEAIASRLDDEGNPVLADAVRDLHGHAVEVQAGINFDPPEGTLE